MYNVYIVHFKSLVKLGRRFQDTPMHGRSECEVWWWWWYAGMPWNVGKVCTAPCTPLATLQTVYGGGEAQDWQLVSRLMSPSLCCTDNLGLTSTPS